MFELTCGSSPRLRGTDWKSTTSFGREDLLLLAKVADLTHTRIHELQRQEAKSQDN